jgi:hypothetical protein
MAPTLATRWFIQEKTQEFDEGLQYSTNKIFHDFSILVCPICKIRGKKQCSLQKNLRLTFFL